MDVILDNLIQASYSNNIRTTAQSSSLAYRIFYPYHEVIIDEICKRNPRVSEDGTLLLLPSQSGFSEHLLGVFLAQNYRCGTVYISTRSHGQPETNFVTTWG